jgi:hypothetical protein
MKIVVVWRDNTDYAREVIDWTREFETETNRKVESLDPDTTEGEIFVRARDIVQYPSVVVVDDRGAILRMWAGTPLPSFDEVVYYLREM